MTTNTDTQTPTQSYNKRQRIYPRCSKYTHRTKVDAPAVQHISQPGTRAGTTSWYVPPAASPPQLPYGGNIQKQTSSTKSSHNGTKPAQTPGVQAHQQHHRTVKARKQQAVSKATRLRINQPPANQPADSHPVTSQSSQSAANQPKPDSHPTTPAHPPDGTRNHPRPVASQQQPAASHRQQAAKEPGRPVWGQADSQVTCKRLATDRSANGQTHVRPAGMPHADWQTCKLQFWSIMFQLFFNYVSITFYYFNYF